MEAMCHRHQFVLFVHMMRKHTMVKNEDAHGAKYGFLIPVSISNLEVLICVTFEICNEASIAED